MIKFKKPDNPTHLSFSFYDKNEINHLFYDKLMTETKNVYNLTLFCYNIFDLYKHELYNYLFNIVQNDISNNTLNDDYDIIIIDKLIIYFDDYVKIKDYIKNNNYYIYKFIINYINENNIIINNKNYMDIYNYIYNILLNDTNITINLNKKILFEDIIYKILYSIYNKNYTKTKDQMLNHEQFSIIDEQLIIEIKNNIYMEYRKSKDVKNKIDELLDKKLKADTTYISRFAYIKLGDKTKHIYSTMISTIANKIFSSFSSYYQLINKGYKANKPKYLKSNDKFNLIYFYSDVVVDDITLKLYTSKYISKNFNEIFGDDYIKLDNNTYVHKKYLLKIKEQKIKKKINYVYNNFYISKKHKNIIDSRYIKIDIFRKLKNNKIKTIEIKPMCGTYKVILTYENNTPTEKQDIIYSYKDAISIDLGINNLITIYDPIGEQYIISGGPLKSLNYYVTKKIATAQKHNDTYMMHKYQKIREDKINDYYNRIIKWLTLTYSTDRLIIIGYNKLWKQQSNLGTKGNHNFNKIPFIKLINKIKMKFSVILTEESYTSKCDSLSFEDLCKHENYLGKRINRGLFVSSTSKKINADLNGAINIMRKQIKLDKIEGSNLCNPKRIKIYSMKFSPVDNVC